MKVILVSTAHCVLTGAADHRLRPIPIGLKFPHRRDESKMPAPLVADEKEVRRARFREDWESEQEKGLGREDTGRPTDP